MVVSCICPFGEIGHRKPNSHSAYDTACNFERESSDRANLEEVGGFLSDHIFSVKLRFSILQFENWRSTTFPFFSSGFSFPTFKWPLSRASTRLRFLLSSRFNGHNSNMYCRAVVGVGDVM